MEEARTIVRNGIATLTPKDLDNIEEQGHMHFDEYLSEDSLFTLNNFSELVFAMAN